MSLFVDIVGEFVQGLNLTTEVQSVTVAGSNTTLVVNNAYHLRAGMSLNIAGTDYEVLSVFGEAFTVEGLPVINAGESVSVPAPFYFHGTPIATSQRLVRLEDIEKVPMIYLYEQLRERRRGQNSPIRSANITLYFLDNANFEEWLTPDYYANRLVGLNKLVDKFISELDKDITFDTLETDFDIRNLQHFGTFRTLKGYEKEIFADKFTGVEVSFELKKITC